LRSENTVKKLEHMTEPELRTVMNALAKAVEVTAEYIGVEKPLFALVLFNDPKIAQYVANCRREDIILAMEETVARLRNNQDVPR
jgi:hypothetical protein